MKENPTEEHVEAPSFVIPEDGWHLCKFTEGIDFLRDKKTDDNPNPGYKQDDKGKKTLKLPCIVDDPADKGNGGQIQVLLNESNGGDKLAIILKCVGLWPAIVKKYPGDDVTVFDQRIINGIKTHLPSSEKVYVRSALDKDKRNARYQEIRSIANYKKWMAEGGKNAATSAPPATEASEAPTTVLEDDWK